MKNFGRNAKASNLYRSKGEHADGPKEMASRAEPNLAWTAAGVTRRPHHVVITVSSQTRIASLM